MQAQSIKSAFDAKPTQAHVDAAYMPFTRWGAARVYVVIAEKDHVKAIKKAGIRLAPAYGVTTSPCAFYVGYQNFEGQTPGRALAIKDALEAIGIQSYVDGQSD